MNGFNRVILAGNLTRDPEMRYLPKGTATARFGLAVGRKWKDESGALREETMFIDVDAFGKQAETIGQYLKKGRPILVEGRLKLDTWDDKQTQQKRSKHSIVLDSFNFLDGGQGREGGGGGSGSGEWGGGQPAAAPRSRPQPASGAPAASPDGMPAEEDDVPF